MDLDNVFCPIHSIPMKLTQVKTFEPNSGKLPYERVYKTVYTTKTEYEFQCDCGCIFKTTEIING
jgi:hypothetical protein